MTSKLLTLIGGVALTIQGVKAIRKYGETKYTQGWEDAAKFNEIIHKADNDLIERLIRKLNEGPSK